MEPLLTLTRRYYTEMNEGKMAARMGIDAGDGSRALCVDFEYETGHISFQRVAIYESVYEASVQDGAEALYLIEIRTGDAYRFEIEPVREKKLYETEYGEGMYYVELRDATHIWHDIGNALFTNKNFAYP